MANQGCRFNPTLVRLRLACLGTGSTMPSPFQSHAGSIEAEEKRFPVEVKPVFQSHAGSIEALAFCGQAQCFIQFQSHAGSIEAFRHIRIPITFYRVSIPRWFD